MENDNVTINKRLRLVEFRVWTYYSILNITLITNYN
jgi:hypothetical protein